MEVRGMRFGGATRYLRTNEALQPVAGTRYWLPEFTPVNSTGMPFVVALLKFFFDAYICCHVGGDYPSYVAGVQTFYDGITLFIALKNNTLLNLIFQIEENPPAVFSIGPFEFALLQNASTGHVCQYHVKLGDDTRY
jgi:hypothetical protein